MSLVPHWLPACMACPAVFAIVLIPSIAMAESPIADQIWLEPTAAAAADGAANQPWYAASIKQLSGQVEKLDGSVFSYVPSGATEPVSHTASRVIWIQRGEVPAAERQALTLFRDQKYAEALRPLIASLDARPPVWRQQFLSMAAAQAAWRSGRGKIALELVSQLDRRPLPPMVVGWLPIQWQRRALSGNVAAAAAARLDDDSVAVRLVAASWLLSGSNRQIAVRSLERIRDTKKLAAKSYYPSLASFLLIRASTPIETEQRSAAWLSELKTLPMCIQMGPMFTIAEKLDTANLTSEADRIRLSMEATPIAPYPTD